MNRREFLLTLYIFVTMVFAWSHTAKACDGTYLSVGAGYDFTLNKHWEGDWPAWAEIGHLWPRQGNWQLGFHVRHDSNWDRGWPVNDKSETSRDAAMIELIWWNE